MIEVRAPLLLIPVCIIPSRLCVCRPSDVSVSPLINPGVAGHNLTRIRVLAELPRTADTFRLHIDQGWEVFSNLSVLVAFYGPSPTWEVCGRECELRECGSVYT